MVEAYYHAPRGIVFYERSDEIRPDRETLVFLHGLTADHTLFERQIECFATSYNLIVWDAPAHGKSRPYEGFDYENAAGVLAAILERCGVKRAVMIGQSMGGYVTQSLLKRRPELVKAFVAIDSCPYGESYYSRSDRWWLRQVGWMAMLYPLSVLKSAMAQACACTPYGRENMRRALAPYGKKELCRLLGYGFGGFLTDNCDLKIPCPTLILCGERDNVGKVKTYCRRWTEKAGFPLRMIADAAHNANADRPDAVNAAISEFLKTL